MLQAGVIALKLSAEFGEVELLYFVHCLFFIWLEVDWSTGLELFDCILYIHVRVIREHARRTLVCSSPLLIDGIVEALLAEATGRPDDCVCHDVWSTGLQ